MGWAWLVVALLWVVGALNYLDRVMITTMRKSIVDAIPMTDAQFGLLTSVFLWVYGALSPFAGFLADRFSRSRVVLGSLFVWSAVTWLTGHAQSFEQLVLARAFMGISEAAYIPAAFALIADYHRGHTRSLATGVHMSGIMVGAGMGGLGAVIASGSGQVQEPHDGMAYIGQLPHHPNVYVISGDCGNGLTHGTVAGLLLPSLIQNTTHPWERIYAPNRSRLNALGELTVEAAKSNAPYVDWLRGGDTESIDEIGPGHGATILRGVHVLAVYKDVRGLCQVRNARCPHLSGIVRWNEVEKTWDCPVHGSRFDCHGRVLNGPALYDLGEAPKENLRPLKLFSPLIHPFKSHFTKGARLLRRRRIGQGYRGRKGEIGRGCNGVIFIAFCTIAGLYCFFSDCLFRRSFSP